MDILKYLKMDIVAVSEELRRMRDQLSKLPEDDYRNQKDLRRSHSEYLSDRKSLLAEYHKVSQDISYKNRQTEMIIRKLKADVEAIARQENAESTVGLVADYMNRLVDEYNLEDFGDEDE